MKKAALFVVPCACLFSLSVGAGAPPEGRPLTFRNQVVLDPQGFGYEALRLLVPKDWNFRGGVTWNFGKLPPEPSISYTVSSPDGLSVIQQFPQWNMFWSEDQTLQYSYSQTGATIMEPMDAVEFLREVFIPRQRAGMGEIRVLESQELPELAERAQELGDLQLQIFGQISPFRFPYEMDADAGRVKVEYTQNGRRIIEDFTVVISYFTASMPSMYGAVSTENWLPVAGSFRAPADEIPGKVRLFQIAMDSRRDNPVWSVACTRLAATITREQLRQQEAIFARLRQIGQTLRDVDDIIMQAYEKRNETYDRIFDNYSEAQRGVDTWVDPSTDRKIELPTGYDNAWTNGTDYVFSDSANFNPNVSSTGDWRRLNRKGR